MLKYHNTNLGAECLAINQQPHILLADGGKSLRAVHAVLLHNNPILYMYFQTNSLLTCSLISKLFFVLLLNMLKNLTWEGETFLKC
jgi:hypothetical protein